MLGHARRTLYVFSFRNNGTLKWHNFYHRLFYVLVVMFFLQLIQLEHEAGLLFFRALDLAGSVPCGGEAHVAGSLLCR